MSIQEPSDLLMRIHDIYTYPYKKMCVHHHIQQTNEY